MKRSAATGTYSGMMTPADDHHLEEEPNIVGEMIHFWFAVWFGTALAGALFGILGGVNGVIVGLLIAGVVGLAVTLTFALLSWAFWLSRYSVLVAGLSGACTGVVSTWGLFSPGISYPEGLIPISMAGFLGGLGAMLAARAFVRGRRQPWLKLGYQGQPWSYSLKGLFFRFTVVTLLIACWSAAIKVWLNVPNG